MENLKDKGVIFMEKLIKRTRRLSVDLDVEVYDWFTKWCHNSKPSFKKATIGKMLIGRLYHNATTFPGISQITSTEQVVAAADDVVGSMSAIQKQRQFNPYAYGR